jgi:hypothetical protein
VSLRSGVSRLCGAPGELINVNLTARNLGEKGIATVSVVLEWMSIWSSSDSPRLSLLMYIIRLEIHPQQLLRLFHGSTLCICS